MRGKTWYVNMKMQNLAARILEKIGATKTLL